MRVVLADDHRVVRDGLRWLVSDRPDIEIVGEAADGADLLDLLGRVEADIVLLDISMPGTSGLEALARIASTAPATRVIMLSMHDKPVYVKRAIELGAAGYVLKSAGRDELIRALDAVAAGGSYIQPEIAGPLLKLVAGREPSEELSRREREVVELVAAGLENKQIARRLDLAEATVKTYLKSAFERLGVGSRAEAVAVAMRLGIID